MEAVEVHVDRRTQGGKGAARKLRRAGMIPAVFYGPKRTTVAIGIHEAVHLAELQLPEGVRAVGDSAQPLVAVLPPTVEEAKPAEAAEAAPAEGAPAEGAPAAGTEAGGGGGGGGGGGKKGGGEG